MGGWVYGWLGGWVVGWFSGWVDGWLGGWVVGWMGGSVGQWVGSGHITKYRINLDLIKIIKFCLKIYDLLRHSHLWVGVWVNGRGQIK